MRLVYWPVETIVAEGETPIHRLVEEAVRMVRGHGGEPATPAEMRQALTASA